MGIADFLDNGEFNGPTIRGVASRADRFSEALLRAFALATPEQLASRSGLAGILGAGATSSHPQWSSPAVSVILHSQLAGVPAGSIQDLTQLNVGQLFGTLAAFPPPTGGWESTLEGAEAIVADEILPNLGIADTVSGAMYGTAGAVVTTAFGGSALLTAGHVVGSNATAQVAGKHLNVRSSEDPISGYNATGRVCADVAVLDLPVGTKASLPTSLPQVSGFKSARAGDQITCHLNSGKVTDTVNRLESFVQFTGSHAFTGSCYVTDNLITSKGDSGAATTLDNWPDFVTGHVVGDLNKAHTIIQQVEWQLGSLRTILAVLP